jgi:hypothetical protein
MTIIIIVQPTHDQNGPLSVPAGLERATLTLFYLSEFEELGVGPNP